KWLCNLGHWQVYHHDVRVREQWQCLSMGLVSLLSQKQSQHPTNTQLFVVYSSSCFWFGHNTP
uniref:Uncharacterized protein n=1 Tax=Lates calcarifer TaxID=8187 RepID=A0A4W6CXX0_LATCA